MRKYEGVDVVAVLGAVMEGNTKYYKSDFGHDMRMFEEAAEKPDGDNHRLLWLSRRGGTECVIEREAYLKGTHAHDTWCYHAGDGDAIRAFAVAICGDKDGRAIGDLYELDYPAHVAEVKKAALPVADISLRFEDGTEMEMPERELRGIVQRLCDRHGNVTCLRQTPADDGALHRMLRGVWEARDRECVPAVLGATVADARDPADRPSIRQQLAEGKEQAARGRPAVPKAARTDGLEV
jgi:hypothetical protein